MRDDDILRVAQLAAEQALGRVLPDEAAETLMNYARASNWPDAEALARKFAALTGSRPAWPTLDEAPAPERACFAVFRAVGEALEPLRDNSATTPAAPGRFAAMRRQTMARERMAEDADCADANDLVEMARVGRRLQTAVETVGVDDPKKEDGIEELVRHARIGEALEPALTETGSSVDEMVAMARQLRRKK